MRNWNLIHHLISLACSKSRSAGSRRLNLEGKPDTLFVFLPGNCRWTHTHTTLVPSTSIRMRHSILTMCSLSRWNPPLESFNNWMWRLLITRSTTKAIERGRDHLDVYKRRYIKKKKKKKKRFKQQIRFLCNTFDGKVFFPVDIFCSTKDAFITFFFR
jgi:hypothetical protein